MTRLRGSSLGELPQAVTAPQYDRAAVRPGILHIGLGNFHRAHQGVYYDDLLTAGGDPDWGVVGAGVMPADMEMRRDLLDQDCLYSVTEMSARGETVRVVGAMTEFLPVAQGHRAIISRMADPTIRIVSLTVTEGGYFVSAETGGFNPDHPAIRQDIAALETPRTVFGAIVLGLRERRRANAGPITVMSCDNLPHNGDATRAAVLGIAEWSDPDLARWIAGEVTFPNGMVDRITPATTEGRRSRLADVHGLEDARPVFCEPFRQWVLEDRFAAGRPALEAVGVQFVDDVTPYEHMKIRMLNGGHALIAYPSGLLDVDYAHEAMADPLISAFFDKVERDEVYSVISPVPGATQAQYHAALRERFGNCSIEDDIRRLCFDGSNRQPKFIVPSIADRLGRGESVAGLALESALWCRYCFGETETGVAIAPNDPDWERLNGLARRARDEPLAWLELENVYGEVAAAAPFRTAFAAALQALWRDGTGETLTRFIDPPSTQSR